MALVALAALGLQLDMIPAGRACGVLPLQVELEVPADRTVVAVAVGAEASVEQAETLLNAPGGPYANVHPVTWGAGRSFPVWVSCGARVSLLSGRELSPWQYRALVLRLDYADGSHQWVVQAIPDRQLVRQVPLHLTVSIP